MWNDVFRFGVSNRGRCRVLPEYLTVQVPIHSVQLIDYAGQVQWLIYESLQNYSLSVCTLSPINQASIEEAGLVWLLSLSQQEYFFNLQAFWNIPRYFLSLEKQVCTSKSEDSWRQYFKQKTRSFKANDNRSSDLKENLWGQIGWS